MYRIELHINGMTCGGCAAGLKRRLNESPDIRHAEVNFATESAQIDTQTPLSAKDLVDLVYDAGFSVRSQTTRLHCVATEAPDDPTLEQILADPRVIDWHWHPELKTLDLTTLPNVPLDPILGRLEAIGFQHGSTVVDTSESAQTHRHELWIAIALTLPLVSQMFAMWFGLGIHLPPGFEWALATPVQFWLGRRFYQGAFHAARRGEANMDTLVALGTSVAYGYSLYQWISLGSLATGQLYFEASAVVITLVLVGKHIETAAKHSALEALSAVLALKPTTVTRLEAGQEVTVHADALHPGDVIVVRAGERIGADGIILKGEAEVDAQAMTGEPLPELKSQGAQVVSGTLVVNGQIRIRCERVGEASTIAQVADLVKSAQMGKAPIQQLVDQISRWFVPIVLGIALTTLIGWTLAGASFEFALLAAISVLVIACPCALGLATPTALVAGTGLAAKAGILIKDIQTLEALPNITDLAFDKTGTLTSGHPVVTEVQAESGVNTDWTRVLTHVARESTHPLARAVVDHFGDPPEPIWSIERAETTPGLGIEVQANQHSYRFGQWAFVQPGAEAPQSIEATRSFFARDGVLLGSVSFEDHTRPEAKGLIDSLKRQGLRVHMLTGDRREVASRLGETLGMDAIHAELSPDDKIATVRALRAKGHRVAMIGDGINDGPALAAADVGIALSSGSEIALQSAPVVLMRADLRLIVDAIRFARQTRTIIRQNLFWAFGYNVLCIPLAISGLLTPAIAGAAMALSSISVVLNALRLKRMQPTDLPTPDA
jgi:P-type Cu+ transporter